jgi:TolA-binding protein
MKKTILSLLVAVGLIGSIDAQYYQPVYLTTQRPGIGYYDFSTIQQGNQQVVNSMNSLGQQIQQSIEQAAMLKSLKEQQMQLQAMQTQSSSQGGGHKQQFTNQQLYVRTSDGGFSPAKISYVHQPDGSYVPSYPKGKKLFRQLPNGTFAPVN